MRNHIAKIAVGTLLVFIATASINWLIDPYMLFESPQIPSINVAKPAASSRIRLFETIHVLQQPPEVLILGASREHYGIDPTHPAFQAQTTFNAAIQSQPLMESKEILKALSVRSSFPKQVVLGIMFEQADDLRAQAPTDFSLAMFDASYPYRLLFSLSTLEDSGRAVFKNLRNPTLSERKDGVTIWQEQDLQKGQRKAFKVNERKYLTAGQFACQGTSIDVRNSKKMLHLQEAVSIAYRMQSEMTIFIGPSHARQWETIEVRGMWDQFEEWKRIVVEIIESEAVAANAKPFPFWDFSGYNSITTEAVPIESDTTSRTRYSHESSHYTPAAGDLVLDRIFNYQSPDRTVPDDFGVLLTPQTIEAHLTHIRLERERYRQTHPQDVAEIEAMAREVAKTKRCKTAGL